MSIMESREYYQKALEKVLRKSVWYTDLLDCFDMHPLLEERECLFFAATACLEAYGEVADKNERIALRFPWYQDELALREFGRAEKILQKKSQVDAEALVEEDSKQKGLRNIAIVLITIKYAAYALIGMVVFNGLLDLIR